MIVDARQDQKNSSYSYKDGGGGIRSQWPQDIARFAGPSLDDCRVGRVAVRRAGCKD